MHSANIDVDAVLRAHFKMTLFLTHARMHTCTQEYALRRIRQLNADSHACPGDVGLWLRYAEFQDEAAMLLGKGWVVMMD